MPAGKGKKGGKGKKAVAAATSPLADSVLQRLPPEVLGEIAFHLHGFQASDKFAGARAGRVFKMGDLGLGYYVDTRKPALSDLLPLAATCTEMRAAVLPALLPIAKLELRLACEKIMQMDRMLEGKMRLLDAVFDSGYKAERRTAEERLLHAKKLAKLCGLKDLTYTGAVLSQDQMKKYGMCS
jgi:hypothetical protein